MEPIHFVLLLFAVALGASQTDAQWAQTNGPYGGDIRCLTVSRTILSHGSWGGGVFLSTNNGTRWTAMNTGQFVTRVRALAASGTSLFAGATGFWPDPLETDPSVMLGEQNHTPESPS